MSNSLSNIQEPMSIKQAVQGMIESGLNVVQGIVVSESPLQIQLINDEKMIITSNIMCLPRHLSTYETTVDIFLESESEIDSSTGEGQGAHSHTGGAHGGHEGGDGSHEHSGDGSHKHSLSTFNIIQATMKVYNDLKMGDIVYILSFNHSKKYYILDREA